MNGLCGLLPKRVGRLMKIYVQPCPECGRNDQIVLTRDTILRKYACACYRCDYFGPDARTRRGAVRRWSGHCLARPAKPGSGAGSGIAGGGYA